MTVIMGVAPGWIFSGEVKSAEDMLKPEIVLNNAIYIENLSAPWPELAAKGGRKKVTKFSQILKPHHVKQTAVLWWTEAPGLGGAAELAAVEAAG